MKGKVKLGLAALVLAAGAFVNNAGAQKVNRINKANAQNVKRVDKADVQNVKKVDKADGQIGKLNILNRIETYQNQDHAFLHYPGASEGFDEGVDDEYSPMWGPYDISSKIVSIIPGYELMVDARPENSTSFVSLELSLISKTGDPITINSTNQLELSLPLAQSHGYDFGTKPITLQLENGQRYDVKKGTNNGQTTMILPLPDLNGTYDSEQVYAAAGIHFKPTCDFDNDGEVNLRDLMIFAGNYLNNDLTAGEGVTTPLLGDVAGALGLPDSEVNLLDFAEFCSQYLK